MADWETVPSVVLRATAAKINGWSWPLDGSSARERVAELGWEFTGTEQRLTWTTGWVGSRPRASASLVDGVVSNLRVTTSEVLAEESAESTAFIRDVFVAQVETLAGLFGEPLDRDPGSMPTVGWVLANGAGLTVGEVGTGCYWQVRSPEFMELDRVNERVHRR